MLVSSFKGWLVVELSLLRPSCVLFDNLISKMERAAQLHAAYSLLMADSRWQQQFCCCYMSCWEGSATSARQLYQWSINFIITQQMKNFYFPLEHHQRGTAFFPFPDTWCIDFSWTTGRQTRQDYSIINGSSTAIWCKNQLYQAPYCSHPAPGIKEEPWGMTTESGNSSYIMAAAHLLTCSSLFGSCLYIRISSIKLPTSRGTALFPPSLTDCHGFSYPRAYFK